MPENLLKPALWEYLVHINDIDTLQRFPGDTVFIHQPTVDKINLIINDEEARQLSGQ